MEYSTPVLDTPDKASSPRKDRRAAEAPGLAVGQATDIERASCTISISSRLRTHRVARAALVLLCLMVATAVLAPLVSPHNADKIDFTQRHLAPSMNHPFGTDDLGRDVFIRVMYGGRITLAVGFFSVVLALIVGIVAGAVSGYFGGVLDLLIMRLTDVALSVPVFLVVLLLSSVLAPGLITICVLVGFTQWMEVARVVRSVVLGVKRSDFVEAARALGIPDRSILFRHILTHSVGPVIVAATIGLAQAIMMESALSFLGYGVQPPVASWGSMLQNAQSFLASAPWTAVFPGLMIFLTVLCCYALGDFLRVASQPRRRPLA